MKSENQQIARYVDGLRGDVRLQPVYYLPGGISLSYRVEQQREEKQEDPIRKISVLGGIVLQEHSRFTKTPPMRKYFIHYK